MIVPGDGGVVSYGSSSSSISLLNVTALNNTSPTSDTSSSIFSLTSNSISSSSEIYSSISIVGKSVGLKSSSVAKQGAIIVKQTIIAIKIDIIFFMADVPLLNFNWSNGWELNPLTLVLQTNPRPTRIRCIWWAWWESNPQNYGSKPHTYANSVTGPCGRPGGI